MAPIGRVVRTLRSGNVELLFRRSAEALKENIASTHRDLGGAEQTPEWLSSQADFTRYQISVSEYVTALGQQSADLTVSTDDKFSAVEVPILSPGRADRVIVSVNEQRRELLIDDNFEYPDVIWVTVAVEPCREALIEVSIEAETSGFDISCLLDRFRRSVDTAPKPGLPAVDPVVDGSPILLLSLDALKYDVADVLSPLLKELGSGAVVPDEPRTQGYWTPPSHGSMFTGTHPGDHGYVGVGKQEGDDRPINPEMETLASVLADNGYKNSALVSHGRIRPQFGFGRGFHRFVHDGMGATDWVERKHDARQSVDRLIEWIDADASQRDHNLFYFLHLFDAHSPYIPPTYVLDDNTINFSSPWEYNRLKNEVWDEIDRDYVKTYDANIKINDEVVDLMQSYYEQSVRYTAHQAARLVRHLKTVGLFEQSLIIITGDHGEEWGERGFFTHTSLYDANIRPFMAVKPPRSADWSVRDAVDTIDFLPTVSALVGEDPPAHCRGRPLQDGPIEDRVRITERLSPDWYSVAVERGDDKGIFTYESNYPDRPAENVAGIDPELVEFYSLPAVREGNYDQAAVPAESRRFLKNRAQKFLRRGTVGPSTTVRDTPLPRETEEQLELLGYK